jgi:hypothetical protein
MTRLFKNVSAPLFGLLILVIVLPTTACDPVEPMRVPFGDTATLYSLARAEYMGEASAFDFRTPRAVLVERPRQAGETINAFDIAFSESDDGFVWLPAGVFETFADDAGILRDTTGAMFEEYGRAPSSGYITDTAVPVEEGPVYIVRTRRTSTGCAQYAKLEVLDLDPAGVVEFRFLRNNLCNDRNLSDPEPD